MKQGALYAHKIANAALTILWSLTFTYALTRTVGAESYAVYAVAVALGMLVLALDAGMSSVVYFETRRVYLERSATESPVAFSLILKFQTIATVSCFLLYASVCFNSKASPTELLALFLVFASVAAGLPATSIRAVLNATDDFLFCERAELVRRLLVLVFAASISFGLPIPAYGLLTLLVWAFWYWAVFGRLSLGDLGFGRAGRTELVSAFALLRDQRLRASAVFSLCEFLIYSLPYYVLPLGAYSRRDLVAFDSYFKVTRLAVVAFGSACDSATPMLTRDYLHGSMQRARRRFLAVLCFNILTAIGLGYLLLNYGAEFFARLLHEAGIVSEVTLRCGAAVVFAMAIQTTSGSFLLALGNFSSLARCATGILFILIITVVVASIANFSFDYFLASYVSVFCIGAICNLWLACAALGLIPQFRTRLR